jgi:hypothetical protein
VLFRSKTLKFKVNSLFLTVQTSRTPSPGVGRYVTCPLAGGVAIASGLNATWVSTIDKYRITMGLELSLALVASQGIMHLMDHRLCQWEKQLIKREIGAEMVRVYRIFNSEKLVPKWYVYMGYLTVRNWC